MNVRFASGALLLMTVFAGEAAGQRTSAPASAPGTPTEWRTLISRNQMRELGGSGYAEFYAVDFLNHNIGWAVGGHANATVLFRTIDGGKNWERLPLLDGQKNNTELTDIGFADANNGWIVGRYHILRTNDGGESWEGVDYGKSDPWAKALLVLGPDAIIFGSNVQRKQIVRTMDGGKTWETIALYDDSNREVSGLAFSPGNSAVFATVGRTHASYGALHRSDDGGRTWELVAEADKPLFDVAFHGRNGVAVGENVAFWTADAGATWKRVIIPGLQLGVDFIDANKVVAVGSKPFVVISENGGKTWRAVTPPAGASGHLTDIAAVDAGWWFTTGGYGGNALYQFIDHEHIEVLEKGLLPIPVDVTVGDKTLPRGTYEIVLGHQGDEHVLLLEHEGALSKDVQLSGDLGKLADQQEKQVPPKCEPPCRALVPVDVTYEREDLPGGMDPRSLLKVSLQPTANGVAIVMHTVTTPPRNLAALFAAANLQTTADVNVREAGSKAKQGGGLLERARKAASGDIKGATEGVNPQAITQRGQAAKAAASTPAVYEITLRYPIALFSRNRAQ